MNHTENIQALLDSGNPISIPYIQRKFQVSFEEAKRLFETFFPPKPVKERFYYFREYWRKKNEK
jgi:hypothetical protein